MKQSSKLVNVYKADHDVKHFADKKNSKIFINVIGNGKNICVLLKRDKTSIKSIIRRSVAKSRCYVGNVKDK